MIGDWIQDNRAVSPSMVVGMTPKGNIQIKTADGKVKSIEPSYVEPVVLTAEILEKNFSHPQDDLYILRDDSSTIRVEKDPTIYYVIIEDDDVVNEVRLPIGTVHELQQVLRICRLRIEIRL